MKNNFLFLMIFILSFALTGCSTHIDSSPREPAANKQTFDEFCYSLANKSGKNGSLNIDSIFNKEIFLANSIIGIGKNPAHVKEYNALSETLMKTVLEKLAFGLKSYNNWYVHSSKGDDGGGSCILNSSFSDTGLSIIEFRISNDGQYQISNWRNYGSDILASDAVGSVTKDILDMIINKNSAANSQEFILFEKYLTALKNSDVDTTWKAYNSLPEKYKKNIIYQIRMIEKCENDENYKNLSVAELSGNAPLKNYAGVLLFDYYVKTKDFENAWKLIDRLESRIGKGAVIEILRASIAKNQNDKNKFYAHILETLNYKHSYKDVYWILFDELIIDKHYSDAILVLDILHKGFGYSFTGNTFNNIPLYEDFIQTAEFQNWIAKIQQL